MPKMIKCLLVVTIMALPSTIGAADFKSFFSSSGAFPVSALWHPLRVSRDNVTGARRVWGAMAGVANIADMVSTHQTVCQPPFALNVCFPSQFAHEGNSLFAKDGVLLVERFDAFKLGITLGFVAGEELPHIFRMKSAEKIDTALLGINIGGSGVFGSVAISNGITYYKSHALRGVH